MRKRTVYWVKSVLKAWWRGAGNGGDKGREGQGGKGARDYWHINILVYWEILKNILYRQRRRVFMTREEEGDILIVLGSGFGAPCLLFLLETIFVLLLNAQLFVS